MPESQSYSKRYLDRAAQLIGTARCGDVDDSRVLDDAIRAVDWWRESHSEALDVVVATVRDRLDAVDGSVSVTERIKRFDTIVDKLARHPRMHLTQMEDIAGVRAMVPDQATADSIVATLQADHQWIVRRVREYVAGRDPGPKPDGYRAIHLVVRVAGRYVEVQLRTPMQDRWAQQVEQATRDFGLELKFGGGPNDLRDYFRLLSEVNAAEEIGEAVTPELQQQVDLLRQATARYLKPKP